MEPNDPGSGAPGVFRTSTMRNHGQPGVPCKHLLGAMFKDASATGAGSGASEYMRERRRCGLRPRRQGCTGTASEGSVEIRAELRGAAEEHVLRPQAPHRSIAGTQQPVRCRATRTTLLPRRFPAPPQLVQRERESRTKTCPQAVPNFLPGDGISRVGIMIRQPPLQFAHLLFGKRNRLLRKAIPEVLRKLKPLGRAQRE